MREIFPYQVITCSWHSFLSLLSLWSFLSSRSSLSNRSLLTLDKKRKLIKKRLYVVIKQLWEINVFHGYLSSCVERKNFRCPPLCWVMFKPYQVLTAVPDPTNIAVFFFRSSFHWKIHRTNFGTKVTIISFLSWLTPSPWRNKNLTY